MLKIALTGPTGSGKGYISSILSSRGIPTLDSDKVVHALYDDRQFASQISALFGEDLTNERGGIDRKKLGAIVYHDDESMKKLLDTVYPAVHARCLAFFKACEDEGKKAAAIDAPQLFEAGFENDCDMILCVTAPADLRLSRIMARDGIDGAQAKLRMAHQMSEEEYISRSDAVINTNEGADVACQIDALLREWDLCK